MAIISDPGFLFSGSGNLKEKKMEDLDEGSSRGEKRKMFLQGIRNLVPELQHAPIHQEMAEGHFSLLQSAQKHDKMPFLGEIFQQVSRGSNIKKGFINKVTHFYSTTQPAEGGLLQPRVVPKELRRYVPVNLLAEPDASGCTARLKPNTLEGLRESSALSSHAFATASLRISNNLELGAQACNTVLQQSRSQLNVLRALDLPQEAKVALAHLNRNLALMNNTVFDMKSTNSDLLHLSVSQYNKALTDRRNAWVESTHLALGVKRELIRSDLVSPQLTDQAGIRLSMWGTQDLEALEEHYQILLEKGLSEGLQDAQNIPPDTQGKQPFPETPSVKNVDGLGRSPKEHSVVSKKGAYKFSGSSPGLCQQSSKTLSNFKKTQYKYHGQCGYVRSRYHTQKAIYVAKRAACYAKFNKLFSKCSGASQSNISSHTSRWQDQSVQNVLGTEYQRQILFKCSTNRVHNSVGKQSPSAVLRYNSHTQDRSGTGVKSPRCRRCYKRKL